MCKMIKSYCRCSQSLGNTIQYIIFGYYLRLIKRDMKKILIILVFSFLLLAFNLCFGQDWKWLNPIPTGNNLNNVKFLNADTGYAAGDYGTILKTTDGGNNWITQNSGTTNNLKSSLFYKCKYRIYCWRLQEP